MAALNKPEPRAKAKARRDRQKAKARDKCCLIVWGRAQNRCEICGVHVWHRSETVIPALWGSVHEPQMRSKGADPTDPAQCLLVCVKCDASAHHLKVRTSWP